MGDPGHPAAPGLRERLRGAWNGLKTGERVLLFTVGVLLVFGMVFWVLAITGVSDVMRVRDVYEESPEADVGFHLVKQYGCRNCHTVLKVGEWGLAPELDGEGTRHPYMWIRAYLEDPRRQMNGKTLHDGRYAMDFTELSATEKDRIATFLFAQKSMPGSANYPEPPR
ncbi:MAG: c-type cytochrome [Nitrospirota bacterium]|nr:c-type cytochrome [Nitrospirota bacterium]